MGSQEIAKTRLGDLLIERGLISERQLQEAISQQKECSRQLGEILVDNGWVSNRQIKQALKKQSKLRNAILTSLLSFSPMVLVGCGGSVEDVNVTPVEQGVDYASQSENEESASSDENATNDNQDSDDNDLVQLEDVLSEEQSEELSEESSEEETAQSPSEVQVVLEQGASEEESEESSQDQQSETEMVSNESETVNADAGATIQLSWAYPELRTDGSDLELYDIESFRVYQISEGGEVGQMHEVDGTETQYEISDLADGEYHFAITVVDSSGNESDLSDQISVSVL